MAASSDVWALVELVDGQPTTVSLEAVTAARSMADLIGANVAGLVVDAVDESTELAVTLGGAGADRVVIGSPAGRSPAVRTTAVAELLAEVDPAAIVAPGSDRAGDVAARLAVRLGRPLVEDCVSWRSAGDGLGFYRPGPGNRVAERIATAPGPVVVLPPGTVPARDELPPAAISEGDGELDFGRTCEPHLIDVQPEDKRGLPLEAAEVIVAGGRGLGDASGFELLGQLADALGGTVGASRMATDQRWVGTDRLVGQTGKVVRPRLYLACGISGASQHVAGMRESETIVAINIDANAPIAALADVMAVGEIDAIVPALIEELSREDE